MSCETQQQPDEASAPAGVRNTLRRRGGLCLKDYHWHESRPVKKIHKRKLRNSTLIGNQPFSSFENKQWKPRQSTLLKLTFSAPPTQKEATHGNRAKSEKLTMGVDITILFQPSLLGGFWSNHSRLQPLHKLVSKS
jgi:16S rRNA C1402 N4-methylase RsmH